jgi:hypothetical protein
MANPISDRRYAFSAAALASGASPKSIRNWLDKGQVSALEAEQERKGAAWRRFSVIDVLTFAIVKRLVDFGAPVEWAAMAAGDALGSCGTDLLRMYRNTPPAALAAGFSGATLVTWREGTNWNGQVLKVPDAFPAGISDAFLIVDLGAVCAAVVGALADLEQDGGEREESLSDALGAAMAGATAGKPPAKPKRK